jgi:hypothetical protein
MGHLPTGLPVHEAYRPLDCYLFLANQLSPNDFVYLADDSAVGATCIHDRRLCFAIRYRPVHRSRQ